MSLDLVTYPACNATIRAAHSSGRRKPDDIRYGVVHSTESSGSAREIAAYFSRIVSGGSSNLVVDDATCFRVLDDLQVPWGAPPLNTQGFHIEHCGFASWDHDQWMRHQQMLDRSAYKMALRVKAYPKIKVQTLTDAQLRAGRIGGIVTHAQVSRVFHKSDHTDPGDGFPLHWYVNRVGLHRARMK